MDTKEQAEELVSDQDQAASDSGLPQDDFTRLPPADNFHRWSQVPLGPLSEITEFTEPAESVDGTELSCHVGDGLESDKLGQSTTSYMKPLGELEGESLPDSLGTGENGKDTNPASQALDQTMSDFGQKEKSIVIPTSHAEISGDNQDSEEVKRAEPAVRDDRVMDSVAQRDDSGSVPDTPQNERALVLSTIPDASSFDDSSRPDISAGPTPAEDGTVEGRVMTDTPGEPQVTSTALEMTREVTDEFRDTPARTEALPSALQDSQSAADEQGLDQMQPQGRLSSGDSRQGARAQKGILKSASSNREEVASASDVADLSRMLSQTSRRESTNNSLQDSSLYPSRMDTASSEMPTPAPKAEFYIDASGNVREISANTVNVHQFFPELPLPGTNKTIEEGTEKSSDTASRKTRASSSKQASRAHSAAKTVHFDESGPQVTELDDESQMDDEGDEETMSYTETVDSISLPATSPAPSREATSADLFPTQVDEETLEAAKIRQRRRTVILEPEQLETAAPALPTMDELLDARARQHFEEALTAKRRHNHELVITSINKALNLRPNELQYFVERAEAYLALCDYQSAILNYKRVCVLAPNSAEYYTRLAFIYFFQGQCLFDQKLYPEALEAFSRAAEMRPEVIGYHTRSIACLAALKRHGECLALVNKRLETEETSADLYVMRARLHELFRNTTLCYYDVKDALSLDPEHEEALVLMRNLEVKAEELKQQATQLNLVNRHRDALQKISIAIETNPSVPEYHILRGALQRRLCDFNAAIDDYLLALDKTDHHEESPVYLEAQRQLLLTYNDFAVECFTKGFYEEAIILLNKAIKGEKREKGLYINRGDCFFQQGNLQFALADYHQALELDPLDDSIRSRIAIIHNEYGIQEFQDKNYQEAESRFQLALQHSPKVGQYYISRSRARMMMEEISSARTDLLMALHLEPGNEEIPSLMARLFPGKSIKEVMQSRAGAAAKTSLGNLVVMAGPVKLPPMKGDESLHSQRGLNGGKSRCFPSLKSCMEENKFHIKIAKEKRVIQNKMETVYHQRRSLRHRGGRVQGLPGPLPPKPRKETLALKPVARPEGWKKFTLGIGLTGIPDNV